MYWLEEGKKGLVVRNRWWIYQRERFPLFKHGLLIVAFSSSGVCLSLLLRQTVHSPSIPSLFVAFFVSFILFFQLRIADEYKDYETDLKFRPYRPVQRGLISLKELGWVAAVFFVIQIGVTLWYSAKLIPILLGIWLYLYLMTKEFFVKEWLLKHPMVYMFSHMLIIPFIDIFITACDWLVTSGVPPSGLIWFILLSYSNGMLIEMGRKIRVPDDEETGVETYSRLWGLNKSCKIFLIWMSMSIVFALKLAFLIHFFFPIFIGSLLFILGAGILTFTVIKKPTPGKGKSIELFSGLWVLGSYVMVGIVPMLIKLLQ